MTSSSVNRCIAIAAHGRRCQQSTYRGSPYCWHHTQSRKVPAPSRMAPRPRGAEVPVIALATPSTPPPPPAIERIAARLNRGQLEQVARFLEAPDDGAVSITRANGYVEIRDTDRSATAAPRAHRGG